MIDFRNLKVGDEVGIVSGRTLAVGKIDKVEIPHPGVPPTVWVGDKYYFVDRFGTRALDPNSQSNYLVELTPDIFAESERDRLAQKIRDGLAYKTLDELRKIAWVSDHEELFEIPEG